MQPWASCFNCPCFDQGSDQMVPKNAELLCDSVGWTHLYIYTCVSTQYDCKNSTENEAYKNNRNVVKFVSGRVKKFDAHLQSTVLISLCLDLGPLCNTGHRLVSIISRSVFNIFWCKFFKTNVKCILNATPCVSAKHVGPGFGCLIMSLTKAWCSSSVGSWAAQSAYPVFIQYREPHINLGPPTTATEILGRTFLLNIYPVL